MAKAGHDIRTVKSRLHGDLQITEDIPQIDSYVECIFHNKDVPNDILDYLENLSSSKYDRLEKRGYSEAKMDQLKALDSLYGDNKERPRVDPRNFGIVTHGADNYIDCVVNSTFSEEKQTEKSISQKRAEEYRKEAGRIRIEFDKSLIEQVKEDERNDGDGGYEDIAPTSVDISNDDSNYQSKSFLKLPSSDEAPIYEKLGEFKHPIFENKFDAFCLSPNRIFRFDRFIPPQQCEGIIKQMNFSPDEIKIKEKSIRDEIERNRAVIRTSLRRKIINPNIASIIWEGIKDIIPNTLEDGRKIAGIRSAMNFYRYSSGEFFDVHVDGGYLFRDSGISSEFTFIIYLNDCESGGSTRFCDVDDWDKKIGHVSALQGRVLIFRQRDLKHCGIPVEEGNKYIIQGMVMYYPPVGGKPVLPSLFHPELCKC